MDVKFEIKKLSFGFSVDIQPDQDVRQMILEDQEMLMEELMHSIKHYLIEITHQAIALDD